jgi:hypothetical protein
VLLLLVLLLLTQQYQCFLPLYGPPSFARRYLLHYGFAVEDNLDETGASVDTVRVQVSELQTLKTFDLSENAGDSQNDLFLREMRIRARRGGGSEAAAMELIRKAVRARLARYRHSYEADVRALVRLRPFSTARHIVLVLKAEKQILWFYSRLAAVRVRLMKVPERCSKVGVKYNEWWEGAISRAFEETAEGEKGAPPASVGSKGGLRGGQGSGKGGRGVGGSGQKNWDGPPAKDQEEEKENKEALAKDEQDLLVLVKRWIFSEGPDLNMALYEDTDEVGSGGKPWAGTLMSSCQK